ncbi:MAG: DNA polymerase [Candidatus Paceibacterota bacterium]
MAKTKAEKNKRLVLLDAHAILHRAYHALPQFASSKGEPTGALYGISAMIIKIIDELSPDYIVACFDLPQKTYRHEAYEGYKSGRKKSDPELVAQINRSRDIFAAFGIPIYEKAGFEADDILGTIVEKMKNDKKIEIVIASGDMDTMQLVAGKKVQVYTLKKGINDTILYDEDKVVERFGFKPELLPDYKGLRGDPSDNIIGISGIGEKTATDLIKNFGSIENIYKELKKDTKKFEEAGIKERMIGLLKEKQEEAEFSKMLALIRRDAPIDFELPKKSWAESLDFEKIENIFRELEFRTMASRVKELLSKFTDGGDNADKTKNKKQKEEVTQSSFDIVSNENILPEDIKEAAIALWILNSNLTNPSFDDILRFSNTKSFEKAHKTIFDELKKQDLLKVFEDIEKPLIPVVDRMEKRGIKIDTSYLKKLGDEYHTELSKLEKSIWKMAGEEFNINSPKQIGEILFEKMGLVVKNQKKTSTGAKSTRESELEKMRDAHPIIDLILKHRELQKLLSTYIDNIPSLIDVSSGRLHAKFLQSGTTTGRMSSQDPNLQNIPIKSDLGKKIRRAFVAEKGFKLVAFDYSQIELRIAAFLADDKNLIEIFKSGEDVHSAVASHVFNVSLDKVDYEMRRRAKVINFGIIYGMGVNALRGNLGTSRDEAQAFYNEYFKKFSGLAEYLENVKKETAQRGYTETFFGRRRHFEGINSSLPFIRAMAERMAINAPIQGTEADIVKIAMAEVEKYVQSKKLEEKVWPILQVHDELVFEIDEKLVKEVAPEIKKIMENVLPLKKTKGVPIFTEGKIGDNWGEMEKI